MKLIPSQEILRELIDYAPHNGKMRWKPRGIRWFVGESYTVRKGRQKQWNSRYAWASCGYTFTASTGYQAIRLSIFDVKHLAHRIVWKWMTGNNPPELIDHLDGNATNNRWNNLREATHSLNQRNKGKAKNNSSGCTGVTWDKSRGKWKVSVKVNGKMINVGRYESYEVACLKAKEVRDQNEFGPSHGKIFHYRLDMK